eukprot:CAMPEP_0204889554 /NCGR_PEP_ID=MMETSP1349-20130617/22830_1 /ASSEMBLY_ACC=CAM_ASM_000710 /TAXON_ID=215587 /ORGANISM="Aplanochytrium stocchinoi, Strain GSBS06" /LENGTH=75 /DNA_ID=CAMNT_0052053671 /DNA_START=8 /DNA_END=235 /DNA_ORIENTATION=-
MTHDSHDLARKATFGGRSYYDFIMEGSELRTLEGVEVEYQVQKRSAASDDDHEGTIAFLPKRKSSLRGNNLDEYL